MAVVRMRLPAAVKEKLAGRRNHLPQQISILDFLLQLTRSLSALSGSTMMMTPFLCLLVIVQLLPSCPRKCGPPASIWQDQMLAYVSTSILNLCDPQSHQLVFFISVVVTPNLLTSIARETVDFGEQAIWTRSIVQQGDTCSLHLEWAVLVIDINMQG